MSLRSKEKTLGASPHRGGTRGRLLETFTRLRRLLGVFFCARSELRNSPAIISELRQIDMNTLASTHQQLRKLSFAGTENLNRLDQKLEALICQLVGQEGNSPPDVTANLGKAERKVPAWCRT